MAPEPFNSRSAPRAQTVTITDIADLCGHAGTSVTEKVYRHQLRPVLLTWATAMDRIFALDTAAQR